MSKRQPEARTSSGGGDGCGFGCGLIFLAVCVAIAYRLFRWIAGV